MVQLFSSEQMFNKCTPSLRFIQMILGDEQLRFDRPNIANNASQVYNTYHVPKYGRERLECIVV